MGDMDRTWLTVELRRAGKRYGVKIFGHNEAPLLDEQAQGDLSPGEREAFTQANFKLTDGSTCSLADLIGAFSRHDGQRAQKLLTGDNQIRTGEFLVNGIFGDERAQYSLFSRAFGVPLHEGPVCSVRPVRLVVRASRADQDLLQLPWRALAFHGRQLRRHGWIVTVNALGGRLGPAWELHCPCSIVLLAPRYSAQKDIGTENHLESLKEELRDIHPAFGAEGRIREVRLASEVKTALGEATPSIVYGYGHGKVNGERPSLLFEDGPLSVRELGGDARRPAEEAGARVPQRLLHRGRRLAVGGAAASAVRVGGGAQPDRGARGDGACPRSAVLRAPAPGGKGPRRGARGRFGGGPPRRLGLAECDGLVLPRRLHPGLELGATGLWLAGQSGVVGRGGTDCNGGAGLWLEVVSVTVADGGWQGGGGRHPL